MANNVKIGAYDNIYGESVDFSFKTSLSASDKVKFVDFVSNSLLSDGGYYYVIKDIVFDFAIVYVFTDVDVSEIMESPNSIDEIEEFLKDTTIVEIVKLNVDDGVIEELEKAVVLNIEYRTGIHGNPIAESLASLLDTIERKVEGIDLGDMMDAAQALSGISGELTPEKMLEAYANTDMFKNRHDEFTDNDANDATAIPIASSRLLSLA